MKKTCGTGSDISAAMEKKQALMTDIMKALNFAEEGSEAIDVNSSEIGYRKRLEERREMVHLRAISIEGLRGNISIEQRFFAFLR